MKSQDSFTLVELLITITLIGIMAATVVLVINPAQLLAQGRDVRRIGDLGSINQAVASYIYQGPGATGLGSPDVVYISLPDPTLTGSQTSTCSSLGLPALPTGWTYNCVSQQNLFNTNGTGWMPVNLSQIPGGSPISALPVDPTNSPTGGEYYTYATNGTNYELTAHFESNKYQATAASDGGVDPTTYEVGNNLALTPFLHGLVGFWPLNEGSGTIVYDRSGWGNNGTLNSPATYISSGCVSNYCVNNTNGGNVPISSNVAPATTNQITVLEWFDDTTSTGDYRIVNRGWCSSMGWLSHLTLGFGVNNSSGCNAQYWASYGNLSQNTWYFLGGTFNGSVVTSYVNGAVKNSTLSSGVSLGLNTTTVSFIDSARGNLNDVYIYNIALTPSQIQAIYNAEKPQ
jgi:type II secretory pathway pseudopilin PulG